MSSTTRSSTWRCCSRCWLPSCKFRPLNIFHNLLNLSIRRDIVRCLLELCDIIMFFMNQRRDTERRVFKVQPSPCVNIDVDLKSIVLRGDPSALEMKVPKVIQVLYRDMDVRGTEMMIRDIEVYCGKRGLPVDYSEAGTEDLKESIEAFRFRYDEFNSCATGERWKQLPVMEFY